MVELFLEGGPFMWPILILLLAGLGLVGERAYSLNQSKAVSYTHLTLPTTVQV